MDCNHRIEVPQRSGGGKKMKKRKELDALIAHSITKRGSRRTNNSQDMLLSVSTDDLDDFAWMSVASTRRNNRQKLNIRKCGPFVFGITTALCVAILYWLYFDLRQQISDYQQKFEEVSAINKIFPDTLQQWHETTSFLIKNQTFVISQINELTQCVEQLGSNLSSLQATVNAQRNYGQDKKLVADFGAKLEAVIADIEVMKEHYNNYIEVQKSLELETEHLKANMSQLSTVQANPSETNFTRDVDFLNQSISNSVKILNSNIMNVNSTLSQKIQILQGEILAHKIKLDDLLDRSQNMISHVATLSNNLQQFKQKLTIVDEQLNKLNQKKSEPGKDQIAIGVSPP
ncbi:uncharacterized protein LOC6560631 [Drosophila grimshawi]|uniref:GH21716 n=1 Tax=Drosophila grimshawi TaxID=7222 RepID=B4J6E2_DROGR|nr:uncharacterized protein LOC6560631 [Drosophila grimshawi]EDW01943.1 GH21716 [Drosophila grimshawi]